MADKEQDTTKLRILEAAGEIFATKGFDAATVRDICQAAGANLAAVNYYFGDKQNLYVEAVKHSHRWRMEQASLPEWPPGTSPEAKLADFIRTFILRIRSEPSDTWHTRLVMRAIQHPDEVCAALVQDSIQPQFEVLVSVLREMLPPGTTDEKLHLTAFSIVGQCLLYHLVEPVVCALVGPEEYAGYQVDKLAPHITEFVLSALSPQSASKRGRSSSTASDKKA